MKAIIVADGLDVKLVIFTAGFDKIQKKIKNLVLFSINLEMKMVTGQQQLLYTMVAKLIIN